ncbi:MAG: SpvB/TcaC N-terminal domain-containing protein, partial [Patescibacteria group bacterium]
MKSHYTCTLLLLALLLATAATPTQAAVSAPEVPTASEDGYNLKPLVKPQMSLFTGDIDYKYPINVPPGTAGMQPNLFLQYTGGGGSGWLGYKWELGGINYITRNEGKGTPTYDNTKDEFVLVLDGTTHELVKEPNTEHYHSRVFAGLRATFDGYAWEVRTGDGRIYRFGNSTNSRITAVDKGGALRVWALTDVRDRYGNRIEYTYDLSELNYGNYYPSLITYTKNDINPGLRVRKIQFSWIDNPAGGASYRSGSFVKTPKILDTISIKVQTQGGTDRLVREYKLGYHRSSSRTSRDGPAGPTLLTEINEYGSDGTSYLPTVFEYYETSTQVDLVQTPSFQHFDITSTFYEDLNGDNRNELIFTGRDMGPGPGYWQIYRNDGDHLTLADGYESPGQELNVKIKSFLDIDGDGLLDIVLYNDNILLNRWSGDQPAWVPYELPYGLELPSIDIDGDGKLDIVQIDRIFFNKWQGQTAYWQEVMLPEPYCEPYDHVGHTQVSRFVDVDHDGAREYVHFDLTHGVVYKFNGFTWIQMNCVIPLGIEIVGPYGPENNYKAYLPDLYDLNLDDVIDVFRNTYIYLGALDAGGGLSWQNVLSRPGYCLSVFDVNGDCLIDFKVTNSTYYRNTGTSFEFVEEDENLPEEPPDQSPGSKANPGIWYEAACDILKKITFPTGGYISFTYRCEPVLTTPKTLIPENKKLWYEKDFENDDDDQYHYIGDAFYRTVVASETVNDGRGNSYTSTFTYEGGLYINKRGGGEMRGFSRVET